MTASSLLALAVVASSLGLASPMVGAFSSAAVESSTIMIGRYRLSGARELRPSAISDDGVHTYIRWPEQQDLPAVFVLNALGAEEMVDGYMRNGIYTIDRVNPRLVFRIDRRVARADRLEPGQ